LNAHCQSWQRWIDILPMPGCHLDVLHWEGHVTTVTLQ
jgi:hypothetical protein